MVEPSGLQAAFYTVGLRILFCVVMVIAFGAVSCKPIAIVRPVEQAKLPALAAVEFGKDGARIAYFDTRGSRVFRMESIGALLSASPPEASGEAGSKTSSDLDAQRAVASLHPSFSHDGRHLVFAVSQVQGQQNTLWVSSAGDPRKPYPITSGEARYRTPSFHPTNKTLYFSRRKDAYYEIWRGTVEEQQGRLSLAQTTLLASAKDGHCLFPSPSKDGKVTYVVMDPETKASTIWLYAGGQSQQLTGGPLDTTPSFLDAEDRIVFARIVRQTKVEQTDKPYDSDLYTVGVTDKNVVRLLAEPLSDQKGPTLDVSGQFLFSTSVFSSVVTGRPILSSITVLDRQKDGAELRALHARGVVRSRSGVAVNPLADFSQTVSELPVYGDALRQAIRQDLIRRRLQSESNTSK